MVQYIKHALHAIPWESRSDDDNLGATGERSLVWCDVADDWGVWNLGLRITWLGKQHGEGEQQDNAEYEHDGDLNDEEFTPWQWCKLISDDASSNIDYPMFVYSHR